MEYKALGLRPIPLGKLLLKLKQYDHNYYMKVNKTAHFGSCNLSIQEAEAGGLPGRVQGYPGLCSESEGSLYISKNK